MKVDSRESTLFFAFGVNWNMTEDNRDKLAVEFRKLADFYLDNPKIDECSIFSMDITSILSGKNDVRKWCGSGTSVVSIGVDGKVSPCHMFQPNSTTAPAEHTDIDYTSIVDFTDPTCAQCIIEAACPNCYGMNYLVNRSVLKREKSLCEITKIRAFAVSYLRGKQLERGLVKVSPFQSLRLIESIKIIQTLRV